MEQRVHIGGLVLDVQIEQLELLTEILLHLVNLVLWEKVCMTSMVEKEANVQRSHVSNDIIRHRYQQVEDVNYVHM